MFKRDKVKLPTAWPDGSTIRKHPLLKALEQLGDMGISMSDIAKRLDVAPQTLWIWKSRCKKDRNFLLPAEQVPALSIATGVAPWHFRPDLWRTPEWTF